jgi:hypothetical protein
MSKSEDHHLQLINMFAGFCRDCGENWPSFLQEEGYSVSLIERSFKNKNGEEVSSEIILVSEKHSHAIFLECKSGRMPDEEDVHQASKYSKIDIHSSNQGVSYPELSNFDNVYFVLSSHSENWKKWVQKEDFSFPLVTVSKNYIKKIINKFSLDILNEKTKESIEIDLKYAPSYIIPISPSGNLSKGKIYEEIITGLVSFLIKRDRPSASYKTLISEYVFDSGLFDCFPQNQKNTIFEKAEPLIRKISKRFFSEFLSVRTKKGSEVTPFTLELLYKGDFNPKKIVSCAERAKEELDVIDQQMDLEDVLK